MEKFSTFAVAEEYLSRANLLRAMITCIMDSVIYDRILATCIIILDMFHGLEVTWNYPCPVNNMSL